MELIIGKSKRDFKKLISYCSTGKWEKLANRLYDHFCTGYGNDFKNDDLINELFIGHDKTQACIKKSKERFISYLKKCDFDMTQFNFEKFHDSIYGAYKKTRKEPGISRPQFDGKLENITGPVLCVHNTQGFSINARNIRVKNGIFSCSLLFEFYDHFGLDSQDIMKFHSYPFVGSGFTGGISCSI